MDTRGRRWRWLTLASLVLALLCGAGAIALPSARQADLRGTVPGYPPPIRGADQLRVGVNTALEQYDPVTLEARLADLARRGVGTLRQEFRWNDLEPREGAFDWTVSDRIFAAVRRHDMRVLAVLWTTPEWARAATGSDVTRAGLTMPPRDAAAFARFAGAFASRYGGPPHSVLAYQIWDEPNLSAAWGDGIVNPLGYLRILRAAGDAIRAAQPDARIVLAGLAPTVEQSDVNLAPQAYLARLYDAGGGDAFDIAAAKPYGFDLPPGDRRVDPSVLNFSHVILMYETMVVKGDGRKAIWLTQFGWNALPPGWQGKPSPWAGVSESQQAQYLREAVRRAAREWYWAGAMFVRDLEPAVPRDDPARGFGLLVDGAGRPAYDALADAVGDAHLAARGQSFAVCDVLRARSVPTEACYGPNEAAHFSEGWRFGELGADIPQREAAAETPDLGDDPRVDVHFSGDAFALFLRRGNYRATAYVTVDGQPANRLARDGRGAYIPMWSADLSPRVELVEVAGGLGPGEHVAVITVERGWNQWALVGWTSRSAQPLDALTGNPWARAMLLAASAFFALMAVLAARRAGWPAVAGRIRAGAATPVAFVTAAVMWAGAFLSWAQDAAFAFRNLGLPVSVVIGASASALAVWTPAFALSLAALGVLAVIVWLRLDAGLALLAFFVPFYLVPQRIFAYSLSMAELLTLMCAAAWAARMIQRLWASRADPARGPWRVRITLLDAGVLALVLVAALSTLQAQQRVEALRELRMVIAEPALAYLMLRTARLDADQRQRVLRAFVLGAAAIAVIGLANYARGNVFSAEFGLPRIKSVYGSPNNDALYLGRAIGVLAALVLAGGGGRARVCDAATFGVVGLALVLSQSRGALFLGVPLAVAAVGIAAGGRPRMLAVGLLAVAAAGLLVLATGTASQWLAGTRYADALDLSRGTGFFRVSLWQSAFAMWRDHPLLGVGPDNFLYAYRSTYILPAAWQEPNLSHPHNLLMDFASRLGALGVLVLGLLAAGTARAVWLGLRASGRASTRVLALACCGLVADMLGHGMVDHSFFLVDLAFAYMIVAGLLAGTQADGTGSVNTTP